ncbi:MAG: hypothetical protein WC765_02085 [Phycisphaerae bacterium]|jgi:hypothetical protein
MILNCFSTKLRLAGLLSPLGFVFLLLVLDLSIALRTRKTILLMKGA